MLFRSAARQINPEVPQVAGPFTNERADQRYRDGDPSGSRSETLYRDSRHLGKMAEGHLTRIRLPTGVGHETDRDIEAEVGSDGNTAGRRVCGSEPVRIQRQRALQTQQGIEQDKINEQDRKSV